MNKAILASLETAKEQNAYIEFDNPVERMRKEGFPVGLKNIGNSNIIFYLNFDYLFESLLF